MKNDDPIDTDPQSQVRAALEAWLSPEKLLFLDRLITAIENQPDEHMQRTPFGPEQRDDLVSMEDVKAFLEANLSAEQMGVLDRLISQLDTAELDEDGIEDLQRKAQARAGGAAGMQREETGNMSTHAMDAIDEVRDIQRRLKAAGVPIGNQPHLGALRHLAQHHPNMRAGLAMDARRSRPDLSLSRLFPKIAARFAKSEPSAFAVYPDRERQRAAASARMAFDSRPNADPRLSIRAMFPDIAKRLRV
jgi:hypothetical protein